MITQEAICVTLGQVHRNHEECCNIKPCPQTNQQPTPVLQKSSLRGASNPVLQKSSLRGASNPVLHDTFGSMKDSDST